MGPGLVVGRAVSSAPGLRTYIAQLQGKPNFEAPSLMPRGVNRKMAVASELQRVNGESLAKTAPGLDELRQQGLITNYTVNPVSNTVVVDVPDNRAGEAWKLLNQVPGTGRIIRDREVRLDPIQQAQQGAALVPSAPKLEWNVSNVGADKVWQQGFTGKDVVVGIVDTGVDAKHPALASKYRGANADGTQTNDYNFFDAFGKSTAPYDDNKHGTHVTGTVLGSDGGYVTGMAPDAKFIASKILNGSGSGSLTSVTKGLEWILAPTDVNGKNPDPTKAPDIVSNSWGSNDGSSQAFRNIWKAFNAAGIVPVAAAGNSGPRAGTVGSPGSYPEGISVAATDKNDKVASFSSRGPSPIKGPDGSDRKPDIAAPGHQVTSAIPGGGYATFSGTSMATPGVSGVIALLLSKHKDLTQAEITKAITSSAKDIDAKGYDYNAGHGRIDAAAAMAAADKLVAGRS